MPPKYIQTYPNRPSRLVNLNKSPTKNKKITATNAAQFPFLLLPPEIRGRIYDYAFGGNVTHITHNWRSGKYFYRLDTCLCAQDSGPPQRFVRLPSRDLQKTSKKSYLPYTQHYGCTQDDTRKPLTSCDMPLSLLQVCRQIYHEAALKPFSQTIFIVQEKSYLGSQAFLGALVPTQTRAIKHLQFLCVDGHCPAYKIMQHVKDLETLSFQLFTRSPNAGSYRLSYIFEKLVASLRRVKDFDLKSFHISMLVDETYTTAEKELFAGRLERMESSSRRAAS